MNHSRLILFTTKDGLCSFSDTPIQWNHLSCLNKVLCNFYDSPLSGPSQDSLKKKIFVMGMNTFRNLKMPLPGQYYVLTRRPKYPDNPNIIFCGSLLNIPSASDFLDVWFIGSNSMLQTFFPTSFCTPPLKCHCSVIGQIVRIQVCLNSFDLWPAADFNPKTESKKVTHCLSPSPSSPSSYTYSKYFKIPKNYGDVSELYKEYVYNDIVGQKTIERVCLFKIQNKDCGCEFSVGKLNPSASKRMSASDALGIYFTLGHIETIECQRGFPFFKQNFSYYERVFVETMQFLSGDLNCTEFCANFGLIHIPPSGGPLCGHENFFFYAPSSIGGLGELDDCAKIGINKNNLNICFFNILDTICLDTNFLNSLNCSFVFSYLALQNFFQCKFFEIKLVFIPSFEDIQTNLLLYIHECSRIENFPYIVTSLSIILFVIVHYINNHKVFVNSLTPGHIKIMIGKLYFVYGQEIFVQNYEYTPLLYQVFQKPFSCYLPTDFSFPIK